MLLSWYVLRGDINITTTTAAAAATATATATANSAGILCDMMMGCADESNVVHGRADELGCADE